MIHCGIVQSGRKSNGAKGQIRSTVQAQNALRAIQGSGIYKIRSAFAAYTLKDLLELYISNGETVIDYCI